MAGNIWIINEHLTTPDLSENGHSRHYSLGLEFIAKGYDVSLITSSYSHNPRRKVALYGLLKTVKGNIRTLVLKGFSYKKSSSKIRILNWVLFLKLCFLAPFTSLPRPDIIILSSTPMLPVYNVLFFKLLYPKCKFIFETRDLWPMTPMHIGGYSERSIFIRTLRHLEHKCYSRADYIVSVLKNSDKHIAHILGHQRFNFKWISNGIDLEHFAGNQKSREWDFKKSLPEDSFVIGYAGTLGKANAMEYIVESFNAHFKGSNIFLVILGGGGEKQDLLTLAAG
ncbi:MAG: glycosyltransferase family 4 protein, partial [Eudoraea sp.]|nr:glycosyltransferase family 4 protein [Eudoraea sp.]